MASPEPDKACLPAWQTDGVPAGYRLRRLTVRDADRILEFLQGLDEESVALFHPHAFDINHVLRMLRGRLCGLVDAFGAVTRRDDRLAGYVWLSGMETLHPSLGLCVAAEHRGKGLGRALLRRALDEAVLRGKREVHLTVMAANERALRLYLSHGFEVVGEVQDPKGPSYAMAYACPLEASDRAPIVRRHLRGRKVRFVPYTHCDWAWVHTRHWHVHRYAKVFAEVLDIMDRDPTFRWYCDNYACQFQPVLDLRPDLLERFRVRVAEGRVDVCGGYANVRTNMVGGETFVRNLILGRRAWQAVVPEAEILVHADAVDVSVGHGQLPQLLRQAGFRWLRMWRPYSALSLKGLPHEFVWEGLDGSRVLVSRGCYGGFFDLGETSPLRNPRRASAEELLCALWDEELEARTRYADTPLVWLAVGCDDARPLRTLDDTPLDLATLMERWPEMTDGTPDLAFATPSEYYTELERHSEGLPIHTGPLDPCDVAYNCAWNGEKGLGVLRIANDRLLSIAELWLSLASLHGHPYPEERLQDLWKEHLITCAHATQWLYTEDFRAMRARAERVRLEAKALAEGAMNALQPEEMPADTMWLVANPLPWPRREVVELTLSQYGDGWPAVPELADGTMLPHQIIYEHVGQGGFEEKVCAVGMELPPCSLTAVRQERCRDARNRSDERPSLNNGRLALTLREGRVTAIQDLGLARTLEAPLGLEWGGLVLREVNTANGPLHVGPITAEHVFEWSRGEFLETGPVRWRYRRYGSAAGQDAIMDIVLPMDSARVEYEVRLDWPGRDGFLAVRFPLPVPCRMYGDIPFGVEPRVISSEPYGMDHWVGRHSMERTREGLFYARQFVAVEQDEGLSYAVVSGNTDRYFLRQCTGRYLEHLLINSVVKQDAWERQVEQSTLLGKGEHLFRFALVVYSGSWQEAGVPLEAETYRTQPLILEPVRRRRRETEVQGGVRIAKEKPLFSVKPTGVLWSALYKEGDAFCLRVFETFGREQEARVVFPKPILHAERTDLLGSPCDAALAAVEGCELRIPLRPWEIATVRLQMACEPTSAMPR